MHIKDILLATTAMMALSAPSFAADKETFKSTTKIEKDAKGNYSENTSVSKTGLDGTTNTEDTKLDIKVDANGNSDKSKTVKLITDPKGLGNKHVIVVTDTEKSKDGKVTSTHTKTVDGKNIDGTKDDFKTSSKVQTDTNGNFVEKDITTKTDIDGTKISYEENANVSVDANGNTSKSTTTEHVTDPVGLLNKTVVSTSNVEKVTDGLVKSSQKVVIDGKTVENSSQSVVK